MRKSHAPSFKSKTNFEANRGKSDEKLHHVSPEKIRSVDTVLNLLLGVEHSDNNTDISIDKNENVKGKENSFKKNSFTETEFNHGETNSSSDPNLTNFSGEISIFSVMYCKPSTKKHKIWESDGTLEVKSKFLTLRDDKGKILGTASLKSKTLEEGSCFLVGNKEVQIIELLTQNSNASQKEASPERQPVKKRKINISGKRFKSPSIHLLDKNKSGLILPEPNAEHQWHFNKDGLPVTQVCVETSLARNLRCHQCTGISFLYECVMGFKSNNFMGAILADEMGLGKTLQTIALIWTLLKQGPYGNKPVLKKVLIVTPSSLTMNWHNEFIKWLGREKLVPYVVDSKKKPHNMIGPVMIISYEMFLRYNEEIKNIKFDLLICDEGHRLKNINIKTTQLLQKLNCSKRIILTGTPIQNDLKEFYALIDFVNPNILGSPSDFRRHFEEPILTSRQPHADKALILKGEECVADLKRKTSLFLLRRTKEVMENYLPSKNEVVVFCKVTEKQQEIYNILIDSLIESKEGLLGYSEALIHLGIIMNMKKVCNHPALLWKKDSDEVREDPILAKIFKLFPDVKGNFKTELSTKLLLVINFLRELKEKFPREKVVLVSNSTQTLDLLENQILLLGYSTTRLDGNVPAVQRIRIVDSFNHSSSIFVFLLSSKAGGVGLNLTGASRLILYDSDWNPATDLQAMSRIWRDGQKRSVYIYRFLISGTIEEKIFQRQINKQGLCDGIIDPQKMDTIKLSQEEIKDIFSYCEIGNDCLTHETLSCKCLKNGEVPLIETEQRTCQLVKQPDSILKMNELLKWEHYGPPIKPSLLSELCLSDGENINFIFRNVKR